jgi:acyl dehydratase
LLAKLAGVVAVLNVAAAAQTAEHEGRAADGMLTVEQAAALAGVTADQFYRRKRFRSAVVKLGHRTLRVSDRKLRRILAETA